jgi:hypothetical protein
VNISRHGSHALLLTAGELTVVPLDQVAFADALERVDALQAALAALSDSPARQQHAQQVLDQTLDWLGESITTPVAQALASLPDPPSRPPSLRRPPRPSRTAQARQAACGGVRSARPPSCPSTPRRISGSAPIPRRSGP